MSATTTFGILGSTALCVDNEINDKWGAPRLRAMLATLLVHAGQPVRVSTLVDWLWTQDDDLPQCPESTFHTYASRIRKLLAEISGSPTIVSDNGGYRLVVDRSTIDYYRFRDLMRRAREHARIGHYSSVVDCTSVALGLWRGQALRDLASESAQAWRTRVRTSEWLPANILLIHAFLELDEPDEALMRIGYLEHEFSMSVALAKLRVSALHQLSRYDEATEYYLDFWRALRGEANEQGAQDLKYHYEQLQQITLPSTIGSLPSTIGSAIADLQHRFDHLRAMLQHGEREE